MSTQTPHITTTLTLTEMESLIRRVVKEAIHEEMARRFQVAPESEEKILSPEDEVTPGSDVRLLAEAQTVQDVYHTNSERGEGYQIVEVDVSIDDTVISDEQRKFHDALRASGLVKEIKLPVAWLPNRRSLLQIRGEPVSATIIAERR